MHGWRMSSFLTQLLRSTKPGLLALRLHLARSTRQSCFWTLSSATSVGLSISTGATRHALPFSPCPQLPLKQRLPLLSSITSERTAVVDLITGLLARPTLSTARGVH